VPLDRPIVRGAVPGPDLLDFPRDAQGNVEIPFRLYLTAFAFYFVTYFVVIFFNSALIGCAVQRFNGQDVGLRDGMQIAVSRLPQITAWAGVSATVGLLLQLIETVNERLGQFVASLLGMAWAVITYFVVPVLVVEKLGPIQSIHRSTNILKKTWGEAVIGTLGLGLIKFQLLLPGLVLLVLGVVVASSLLPLAYILIGAAVAYFLVWSAVVSALEGILLAALYQYATTGRAPNGFRPEIMAGAFTPKSAA
jgi:Family of unknown function (DUF6159)